MNLNYTHWSFWKRIKFLAANHSTCNLVWSFFMSSAGDTRQKGPVHFGQIKMSGEFLIIFDTFLMLIQNSSDHLHTWRLGKDATHLSFLCNSSKWRLRLKHLINTPGGHDCILAGGASQCILVRFITNTPTPNTFGQNGFLPPENSWCLMFWGVEPNEIVIAAVGRLRWLKHDPGNGTSHGSSTKV